jgi:hypothetical protein
LSVKLILKLIKTYGGGAPSRDGHDGSSSGFSSLGGDSDDVGVGVEVEAGADSPQGDVVLVGVGVPVGGVDLLDGVSRSRVGALQGTGNDAVVVGTVAKYLQLINVVINFGYKSTHTINI